MSNIFKVIINFIKILFGKILIKPTPPDVDDIVKEQLDINDLDQDEQLVVDGEYSSNNEESPDTSTEVNSNIQEINFQDVEGDVVIMLEKGKKYSTLPKEYLDEVLKYEGGLVNDPVDKGGKTNRGITESTLKSAIQQGLVPPTVTIESLTHDLESVRKIYETNYYLRAKCNLMPHPLAFAHFDASVNHGVGNAARFIQRTLNTFGNSLAVDGAIGPLTIAALEKTLAVVELDVIVKVYCDIRKSFYDAIVANNPSQQKFYRGWMNRLNNVRKFCGVA